MEQGGAIGEYGGVIAGIAGVVRVVEGAGKEPEAVDGSSEGVAFGVGKEATGGVVGFPPFEGVDFFPMFGTAADGEDLFDEGIGESNLAVLMRRLGGVVGAYL